MNRQIKFRGIATVNDKYNGIKVGDFVYGCFVETNIDCQILFGDGEQISVDRKTVGQFTGLLDKNGVEIYEGDIMECTNKHLWVVSFDRGCFVACDPHEPLEFVLLDDFDFLVIGNIHQNKELLK